MIDLLLKLLILAFVLAIGGCFAIYPEMVSQRFDRWRGRSVSSAKEQEWNIRKYAEVLSLRQMGVLLIVFTFYAIYSWIRTG